MFIVTEIGRLHIPCLAEEYQLLPIRCGIYNVYRRSRMSTMYHCGLLVRGGICHCNMAFYESWNDPDIQWCYRACDMHKVYPDMENYYSYMHMLSSLNEHLVNADIGMKFE